jgi:hypothetical protein
LANDQPTISCEIRRVAIGCMRLSDFKFKICYVNQFCSLS